VIADDDLRVCKRKFKNVLTEHQHRNAEKTGDCWDNESNWSGPSAANSLAVHEKHTETVSWDFHSSSDERVDVDIAVKLPGVESQSVIYQTARKPTEFVVKQ